ncbi:hypothetical protein AAFF_G00285170 [Aldrovandia affinis]|uniref:Uncharacterized protein n=1 Tax=Aldrovandia affinis TaxID=143900 RepID=A0AAD7TAD1_9TELE|nr:hypothetical protein AAFF_G00285170 [Aldrovandia affinis]
MRLHNQSYPVSLDKARERCSSREPERRRQAWHWHTSVGDTPLTYVNQSNPPTCQAPMSNTLSAVALPGVRITGALELAAGPLLIQHLRGLHTV